jgi:hypothetical protein
MTTDALAQTPSLQKEALYRAYARGALSLDDIMQKIPQVQPRPRSVSRVRWLAGVLVAFAVAFVAPSAARRD